MNQFPLESLLSAKQVLSPQIVGDRIFFISDISGSYSLYSMKKTGSYPEAFLPAGTALQNPYLMKPFDLYKVFPKLNKIVVMIDEDGNENYQPMMIPPAGGIPTPLFGETYHGQQVVCSNYDEKLNIGYFSIDDRKNPGLRTIQVSLNHNKPPVVKTLGWSKYDNTPIAYSQNHERVILHDFYSIGDNVVYSGTPGSQERTLLLGTPLEERKNGEKVKKYHLGRAHFTERGILFVTSEFDDYRGLALLDEDTRDLTELKITGVQHKGIGEFNWEYSYP